MRFCLRHGDQPLAGYTILRGIGRGAFGEVYLAQGDSGKLVALKLVLDGSELELRGARACLNLSHPHLIGVHDVSLGADGLPIFILEYVPGRSLRSLIADNPRGCEPKEATRLLRQTASGVACLHEHSIIHRDLKPENVLIDDAGNAKVGDYGLSKHVSPTRRWGHTTQAGTLAYMAPEAGSGECGPAVDVYALGVLYFELLTGRLPFAGTTLAELVLKHQNEEPDWEAVLAACRPVLKRALARDPEARFSGAQQMVAALCEIDEKATAPCSRSATPRLTTSELNPVTRARARSASFIGGCLLMAGLALVVGILVPSRFELVPAPTSHLSNATSLQSEVHAEQFLRSTVGDATQAALAPGNPLGLEALLEAALDLDSPLATRPDAPRNGFTAPCKSPTWRERLKRTIKVGVKRACIRGAEALADRLAAGKAHGQ